MKGINRALQTYSTPMSESAAYNNKKCIFISHKSEDIEAAKAIGDIITNHGIDIYLDINDYGLQSATENNEAKKIVEYIEKALSKSTHILVLVTNKTRQSWWVPYEVGYSKKGEKEIASILLKDVNDFPDFLKIEKTFRGLSDLENYIMILNHFESFNESAADNDNMQYLRNKALNYIRD